MERGGPLGARARARPAHRRHGADVTTLHGIPVTIPGRTLAYLRLDLTGLEARQGRRGAARIRRVLAGHRAGTSRTRSEMEERMLALCDRFGLPRPLCNQVIEGHTVDFVWPQSRVIVETDGWQAHGTRKAFEEDRRRDAHRIANGWRPVRITWRRLETEPKEVADQLLRAIG